MDMSPEASSLSQGLRLVRLVTDREKQGRQLLGVSQLAAELDMEQSRVSRLAQELCDLGLLERVDRGPFRTGPRFFALAASLNAGWVRQSRAELEELVSAFGLRARLSVLDGVRVLLVRSSTNNSVLGGFAKPGMVTPVWCTGSGRALLWDSSAADIESLLADVNFIGVGGPAAAHSAAEVAEFMERDRRQGFVLAAEEFEHGVWELAVPVREAGGGIVAALSVLGSRSSLEESAPEIAAVLHATSLRLGSPAHLGLQPLSP
ncbi:IclR family transcriptional regulator [Paenarthrobacter aurescens]|uniref:Transcriptional regulator n=1 Tax=Paenarthrobacter aurescens TaxID=43663 RepID=A0A4Y3NBR7_PAEAU|nr:IclR family transcriptional regulator C-terminal domain-containing protein [Paenarthrobacter aurescens]MDO6141659.1 helix-turn-helix domain-containing protein [Paenarthrobacter aurescens]MDO6149422.1 helix-turn-helix domain-containing protein [Paenarthrobacter aurescens]MDO6156708.1 helix-turn-helix domain-containing protein [Paenarthrobacter aurescens]MDO6160694.1 helix-turn-helix domain-containing protein [Paenarthrobacter aurescens]GEB18693.1 transcriptional regulator [Paenarthrobacter a